MLSKEDNELLCRVGPGTLMGELMRHHQVFPKQAHAFGRSVRLGKFRGWQGGKPVLVPGHGWERWCALGVLSAPRRESVLRSQRGVWAALCLSWLEVRRSR